MDIKVTQPALNWFKNEMDAEEGDSIRFFVRYGGYSTVQEGFSLGVNKEKPEEIAASETVDGIEFFVEEKDLWYFKDGNLTVKFSRKQDEISFILE
ncbi:HesB/YadR/YfhF family protein [Pseudalkalibacillus caeni]|uniref:Core domain-containing protein n=1 Tax=Exobacillus caeni TaxID=2574798 RepID=A0A5R9F740_9BACL|nr:HesB/YadR/YfhF family protein [Pseudalkalibacillus caeni]TLS37448.1 hypothetical protein FCL54_09890 [Pseudalkalibacillus caeni]